MFQLKNNSVILFDGVCNFCNSSINFIIKHDKKEHFLFASLQSDVAKEILLQFDKKKTLGDSILLVSDTKIYNKSTAALNIAKKLNAGISLFYVFIIIPPFIRDWVYDIIAKNRYKWFGKKDSCMVPSEKIKERFIKLF